jgi:Protein of unknown function, DUF481
VLFHSPCRIDTLAHNSVGRPEPTRLPPDRETGAWKFDQDVALTVAMNTILSLKLAHTLRYSADPPEGFERTDRILAISVVATMRRPN